MEEKYYCSDCIHEFCCKPMMDHEVCADFERKDLYYKFPCKPYVVVHVVVLCPASNDLMIKKFWVHCFDVSEKVIARGLLEDGREYSEFAENLYTTQEAAESALENMKHEKGFLKYVRKNRRYT